jgi:hypothetical protein
MRYEQEINKKMHENESKNAKEIKMHAIIYK